MRTLNNRELCAVASASWNIYGADLTCSSQAFQLGVGPGVIRRQVLTFSMKALALVSLARCSARTTR